MGFFLNFDTKKDLVAKKLFKLKKKFEDFNFLDIAFGILVTFGNKNGTIVTIKDWVEILRILKIILIT